MSKFVSDTGTIRARLISPGQGSSGYYSPALLEKVASKFDGAQCYWDHPTTTEESTRPERSLRDLAGKITPGTAKWEAAGREGPGIYADVQVFQPYRETVNELGPHIGMSIRASGSAKSATIDGKQTMSIESINRVESVDFVTLPGRGGKILQLFEAARKRETTPQGENEVDATEAKALRESVALATSENKKLRERFALIDAREAIASFFTTVRVGEAIEGRVTARLLERTVPVNASGDLDKEAFQKLWEAETKDEAAYVNKLAGGRVVVAMGTTAAEPTAEQREAERKREEKSMDISARQFGFRTKEAQAIFNRGRGEFDPTFNARELGHEPVGAEV